MAHGDVGADVWGLAGAVDAFGFHEELAADERSEGERVEEAGTQDVFPSPIGFVGSKAVRGGEALARDGVAGFHKVAIGRKTIRQPAR